MAAHIFHLDELIRLLSVKTGHPVDTKGLKEMSEAAGLKEKYLYEYIVRKKEKARKVGDSTISVQSSKLDTLAKFLGHKNYNAFTLALDKPIHPVLLSLIGNYYSYVRRNDAQGIILRSPVHIYEYQSKIIFELAGPMRLYVGEVHLMHGCLFILMCEPDGKQIHHVYKIGTRQQPDVLQGIFSGVSTTFDPIGGRTLLVRCEASFKELTRKSASLAEFRRSEDKIEQRISSYFEDYSCNNLQIKRVITFEESDLE